MLTHNTQPADILAFTIKLLKNSHMQPYLYSPALAQYLKRHFRHLTGFPLQKKKHTNYYQTLTYHIVQKCHTF